MEIPAEGDRDDSGPVLGNLEEGRLGHVKVLKRRVAPPTIGVRQGIVRRAKICSCNYNASREAPFWVSSTFDFKASSTTQSVVE